MTPAELAALPPVLSPADIAAVAMEFLADDTLAGRVMLCRQAGQPPRLLPVTDGQLFAGPAVVGRPSMSMQSLTASRGPSPGASRRTTHRTRGPIGADRLDKPEKSRKVRLDVTAAAMPRSVGAGPCDHEGRDHHRVLPRPTSTALRTASCASPNSSLATTITPWSSPPSRQGPRERWPGGGCAASLTTAPRAHAGSVHGDTATGLLGYRIENVWLWGRGVDTRRFDPAKRSREIRARLAPGGDLIAGYVGPPGRREAGGPAGRRITAPGGGSGWSSRAPGRPRPPCA